MDWDLIKQKPDKEFKIVGTMLLELKTKMEQDQKTIADLKTSIDKTGMEKKGVEDKNVAEKSRAAGLEAKIKELEGRIKELENIMLDRYKEISGLKDEKAEMKKEVEVLTREQQIYTETINKSEERIKEAELRREEGEAEIKALLGTISEKSAKVGELRGEVEGIKTALLATGDIKDKEIKRLYSDKDTIRAELEGKASDLNKVIRDLEGEKTRLGSQLKDEKDFAAKKESQLKAADDEKTALRGIIDELKRHIKEKEVLLSAKDFDYFKRLRETQAVKIDKSA